MNTITMQNMLLSLNIPEETWLFSKNILLLNLSNNGNFYNDCFGSRLNFDTTNDLLRVKYYGYRLASSEFFKTEQVSNSSIKIGINPFGSYAKQFYPNEKLKTFRNPEIGDIAYTVDSSNEIVSAALITSINNNIITLDTALLINSNKVCYADGKIVKITEEDEIISLQAIKDGTFLEELKGMEILLYRSPLTIYATDVYLDFGNINGFSLVRTAV